jgi:hypothetical protein
MALAVPAGASPTDHQLGLVIYDPATLQPLDSGDSTPFKLATVRVELPHAYPAQRDKKARFDYLALDSAQWQTASHKAGERVGLSLVWRPQPSAYRDDYSVTVSLFPLHGPLRRMAPQAAVIHTVPLTTPDYPSSRWEVGYPVIQAIALDLPNDLPPGEYAVMLQMQRTSDGLPISARLGWWPFPRSGSRLGDLQVRQ